MPMTIKIHAPFLVKGAWQWHTFVAHTSNVHAACRDRAEALKASAWDTTMASVMIDGTVVSGHPTVFA